MLTMTLPQVQAVVNTLYGRAVTPLVDLVALTTPLPVEPPAIEQPTETMLALTDLALSIQKAMWLDTTLWSEYEQLATYYGDRPDAVITTYTRYGGTR